MFFSGNVTLSFYAVDIFRMATNGVDMVNFIFGGSRSECRNESAVFLRLALIGALLFITILFKEYINTQ